MTSPTNVTRAWHARIESDGLAEDPDQRRVVALMQDLQERITADLTPLARLRRRLRLARSVDKPRGLYLWGDVGRGKTFLMDLFHQTLPIRAKRRVHFHRIMSEVHARLKRLRDVADPLDAVAADIAAEVRVLCFDEFFVSDIGDAMILGRLLEGLVERGVTLVATSNVPPSALYRNGLQRERFLPAVALLERHTDVVELAGETDYRLELLKSAGTWLCPADEAARMKLEAYCRDLARGSIASGVEVRINGRPIRTIARAPGIVWFDFAGLCDGPRSQEDYIEIARDYPAVILSGVPVMTAADDDAARRFIALIDEFYDRRVKLLASAAAPADDLYAGRRLSFEFQRTASRLAEMQSPEYLHAPHLP